MSTNRDIREMSYNVDRVREQFRPKGMETY
jgi:hypothetical protein